MVSGRQTSGRVIPFPGRHRKDAGPAPTGRLRRDAKLAAVPVAYAGRRAAGLGRRMLGRTAAEIDHDIQVRTAEHLVDVLGELRGCAAKLGQMASVYRSAVPLVPLEFGEIAGTALARLQDSAPPMLPALVHQVLAEDFGPGWRERFRDFSDRPAAAASLGQVHRAVWHDGREVAVKVMYPGAQQAVASDLSQLRSVTGIIGAVMPGADVHAVVDMVCSMVGDELDYHREAANQQRCADAFAGDPDFLVPAVVEHTEHVLVSDWVEGIALTRLISGGVAVDERSRWGRRVFRFLEMSYRRCGLLYSDVHPGNFLMLPDGRLAVVDFGACAGYPRDFRAIVADISEVLFNGTPAELDAAVRRHGFVRPGTDFDAEELLRVAAPFLEVLLRDDFRMSVEWLREQVNDIVAIRLSNVFRQMTLPPELTPLARKVGTTVGTLCVLGTDGMREDFLTWWPEVAAAVARYEQRVTAARSGDGD
ncbi:AarF/ABC1/UbiB kinase family protein [Nocardia otitidiscaviarum]|uniref:AarF/ABC1/UbiB kinase family protein n=1 Tax=Nocardia otitidiscaviarum TaxID=1823 RepID=A0A516NNY2_9NOCA|nr:AarF/ABC1/UbiB kinase family protein [Nocardia otitidiscaviarum]